MHTSHCGSRLKVSLVRVHSICMSSMMSHVWAFVVSFLCLLPLPLAPLLFSHCLPVLCPAHQLPCRRNRRGLKPLHSRTMRSIAPWRCTTLSQVMSPSDSTTSTTQRLVQWSSRMNPATFSCDAELDDEIYRKSAIFTTVHSGARRTSEPETSPSLSWRKFVASSVLFRTHKYGETRIRT